MKLIEKILRGFLIRKDFTTIVDIRKFTKKHTFISSSVLPLFHILPFTFYFILYYVSLFITFITYYIYFLQFRCFFFRCKMLITTPSCNPLFFNKCTTSTCSNIYNQQRVSLFHLAPRIYVLASTDLFPIHINLLDTVFNF